MAITQGQQGSGKKEGLSRRDFIKGGVLASLATILGLAGTKYITPATEAMAASPAYVEKDVLPPFKITGVPDRVSPTDPRLRKANENAADQAAKGDVVHENITLLGTEYFTANPGVRTISHLGERDGKWSQEQYDLDLKQIRDGAAYELAEDKQHLFTTGLPEYFGPLEGGFAMYTAASMQLTFGSEKKPINVQLGAEENHGWIVVIKGQQRDYVTPQDLNLQVKVQDYNPGFTLGTRLPGGQFVSKDYLEQNVASMQGTNCGADGCFKVSVLMIDATTGAYTVIEKDGPTATWKQYKTNIK